MLRAALGREDMHQPGASGCRGIMARRYQAGRNAATTSYAAADHPNERAVVLLAAGDQREPVAVGVLEQRPPAEGLLDRRQGELHAAGTQLLGGLQARVGGAWSLPLAKIQDHDHGLVGRAHLQPALLPVGGVLDKLEAQGLGPERLGAILVLDLDDDLADTTDHGKHLRYVSPRLRPSRARLLQVGGRGAGGGRTRTPAARLAGW